jgi:hypothetical protein
MINQQSRTRVTHYFADFQFHVGFVAVDFAFATRGFFVLEGAFIKAHVGVFFELLALNAEFAVVCVVVSFTVNIHHVSDGFFLSYHTFVSWVWRLGLHFNQISTLLASWTH